MNISELGQSSTRQSPAGWSIVLGVLLIVFGLLAIAAPFFAGIAASIFFRMAGVYRRACTLGICMV